MNKDIWSHSHDWDNGYAKGHKDGYEQGRADATRWIPCSERLPKIGVQVLIYGMNYHFVIGKYDNVMVMQEDGDYYYKDCFVMYDAFNLMHELKNVIAWMPLPEAPKEEVGK